MLILSPSPHRYFFATARVPFSISSSSSPSLALIPSSLTARTDARKFPPAILCCSSKFSGTAEIVEELPTVASTSGSDYSATEPGHSRVFLDARTEEDILSVIRKEAENGKLPSTIAWGMKELYHNYRSALDLEDGQLYSKLGFTNGGNFMVIRSGVPGADKIVLSNMALTLDRIFKDVEDPFIFSPYHKAIREPFDYYVFAQNYIRPLIDFRTSYVGNISLFYEMQEKLQQGHNIILISNHQSEADPAVIALLLETTHPDIAQNVTYIAGDRVVTDPLCKPFSKGRNLLCVYSKKHMNDIPELAEMKKRANTRSLKEMTILLRGGSQIIWIAPSGGRDRPDPTTNEWYPAQFDASAVDNMRRLAEHSRVPGHIYPLALLCYDIMPPPAQVEKEIGEKRLIGFHGTGLSAGPAINFHEIAAACGDSEESKMAYTEALYDSVVEQYNVLKDAIHGKRGLAASTASISLSQPWSQSVM